MGAQEGKERQAATGAARGGVEKQPAAPAGVFYLDFGPGMKYGRGGN